MTSARGDTHAAAPNARSGPAREHRSERRSSPRGLQAFTLIELVLSISVSTIICGLAGSLLWNASRQQSEVAARSELVDEASVALEVVLRYLREIPQDECPGGPSPCLNGNAQVASATTTEIRFGNNGFRHNGANLEMTIDNATSWHTLAADVSSLQLTYYDRLGQDLAGLSNPCNDPQKMRRIVVTLTMNRASQTATVRTGVFLRNFMDEVASDPSACP